MKFTKVIAILLCLAVCQSNNAFSQNKKSKATKKQEKAQDNDEEDDSPQDDDQNSSDDVMPTRRKSNLKGGVEGGLIFSSLGGGTGKAGLRAGGLLEFAASQRLHFQPGLYYAMNGGSDVGFTGATGLYRIRMNTLEVPVNAVYKFGLNGKNHIFVGLGLCYGYSFSGTINPGSVALKIGNDIGDNIKGSNLSLNINAGYEMGSGLFFRAYLMPGIMNLYPYSLGQKLYSSSLGLHVGYFFGRKNR